MNDQTVEQARIAVDAVYRSDSRRVLATLIRVLGDFDLAEEALHDAFASAVKQWPAEGVPANPRAWLVSAGRFKAIDAIRRRARACRRIRARGWCRLGGSKRLMPCAAGRGLMLRWVSWPSD